MTAAETPSVQCSIIGTGSQVPLKVLGNDEIADRLGVTSDWIHQRCGIRERRVIAPGETTTSLALQAAEKALASAECRPGEIDLILVATATPDHAFPSTACLVQRELGIRGCPAFDIQATCAGFVYALSVVEGMFQAGSAHLALVIGADRVTDLIDWNDPNTAFLFGDGAGAAVIEASAEPLRGSRLGRVLLGADGSQAPNLQARPYRQQKIGDTESHPAIRLDGSVVFKQAVRVLSDLTASLLKQEGLTADDLDWVLPHQANKRIFKAIAEGIGLPIEHFLSTIEIYGNTSTASIPLTLDHSLRQGTVKPGDKALMIGFGSGFTWGGALVHF